MEIKGHTVEEIIDPTGILLGERFEFILQIVVPEDDELYSENGIYLKAIIAVEDDAVRIAQYQLFEKGTNDYIDLELEDDEKEFIVDYCKGHLA
ncbi:MAG TPA: pullulanase [Bacillus bacterium]|nr:pullulanase [Bacillus sp. (in: firmicutes)]